MRAAAGATYATLRDGCCFSTRNERLRNFCPVKPKSRLPRGRWPSYGSINKGGVMKKVLFAAVEPTTATLLIALAIGLGIAVHPVFFFAALLIAIAALIQNLINAAGHLTHRHP
jgi:hypothetical protein